MAPAFTANVIRNRTSAISESARTDILVGSASALSSWLTMKEAIVEMGENNEVGRILMPPPDTISTAIVSPSARPSARTIPPINVALTMGIIALLTTSKWVAPSAKADSRFSLGTCIRASSKVDAMIGVIINASTRLAASRPYPLPVGLI